MSVEPVTLAAVGTAVSVLGGIQQVSAQRAQANFQSQVARNNQKIAQENALRSIEDAQQATVDQGEEARQELGQLIAAQSASGLSLGVGSSLLRRRAADRLARRDNERLREAGNLRAQGFNQQAVDAEAQAAQARSAGRNALIGGAFNIGSSLISGAQSINKARSLSRRNA